jgi:glyoxylase-like metal-dependent hydrolase (beta-lactamase superfamily II)
MSVGQTLAGADLVGGMLRLPVRAFLVRRAEGCLLIDTGAADAWHPSLGRLGAALAEAGTGPDDVTAVALTHSHVDHRSGLVDADGGPAFPNAARVLVATEELAAFRAVPRMASVLARLVPLEQGDGPLVGVTAINAPGHSPGHMAFLVEGRMLIWGDLVHHAAVQCAAPETGSSFDEDPARARASRRALMEQAVEAGWLVAGAHLPDPGIGLLDRDGAGYVFRPVAP